MFKIGLVQNNPRFLKVQENLEACLKTMEGHQADLWVLPELFASGYNFKSMKEVRACAQSSQGPLCQRLREWARERRCAIVAGFAEKSGARFYNSAVLTQKNSLRVYRKTHLFGNEKKFFSPGNTGFWVEPVSGVKVGVMICFDWFFPESCRTLALQGAQVIAHSANLVLPWGPEGMKIRSLENRVFAATANRIGAERGLRYIGQSQIISPQGQVLKRLSAQKPAVAVVAIEAQKAKDKKLNRRNDLFADRRPQFYWRQP